jgi:hypothetical protein
MDSTQYRSGNGSASEKELKSVNRVKPNLRGAVSTGVHLGIMVALATVMTAALYA